MKNISKILIITISIIFFLSSCSKQLYLSNLQALDTLRFNYQPYRLKPYDYLYITIRTTNDDINKLFSSFLQIQTSSSFNPANRGNYYLTGFMVTDSGYVNLPLLGSFYAQGKTVQEFERMIQQTVDSILSNAIVTVKLISYDVYFIGEVNTRITFYKDKVNILEALSEIGGLPYSARKYKIYLLRLQNNEYKVYTLNLTQKNIVANKNFFLNPNDIIYIPPRPGRIFQLQVQDYYMLISVVTSTLSFISIILGYLITRSNP